jgi:hypothetical protein
MVAAITSRLRLVLNTWTICNLPEFSVFPADMSATDSVGFFKDAGYEGLQLEADDPLVSAGLAAGMHVSATGRVVRADDAVRLCQSHRDMGFSLTTLHVGTGFESQADGLRLMEAVLEASAQTGYPLLVETHRATLTQDPRRTLDFLDTFPELYLNADFSHWYAGCEMPYGDFDYKVKALQTVFDRTRYMHGRMADSSCIQVPVSGRDATNSRHFSEMWSRSFSGFLQNTGKLERISFAPELLPNWAVLQGQHVEINYARMRQGSDGPVEETDRWTEALLLCEMAKAAFQRATEAQASEECSGHPIPV